MQTVAQLDLWFSYVRLKEITTIIIIIIPELSNANLPFQKNFFVIILSIFSVQFTVDHNFYQTKNPPRLLLLECWPGATQ